MVLNVSTSGVQENITSARNFNYKKRTKKSIRLKTKT